MLQASAGRAANVPLAEFQADVADIPRRPQRAGSVKARKDLATDLEAYIKTATARMLMTTLQTTFRNSKE